MSWFGSRPRCASLLLLLAGAAYLTGSPGLLAQTDSGPEPEAVEQNVRGDEPTIDEPVVPGENADFVYRLPDHPPVDEPEPPTPAPWDYVDGFFNKAVDIVSSAFFYRVGRYERTYLVVDEAEYFGREKGTDASFERLVTLGRPDPKNELAPGDVAPASIFHAVYLDEPTGALVDADAVAREVLGGGLKMFVRPRGTEEPFQGLDYFVKLDPAEMKTPREVELMALRGELKLDSKNEHLLVGTIVEPSGEKRTLEIVVAKPALKKFVLADGAFRRDLGHRELLGTDATQAEARKTDPNAVHVLSVSEALQYAREGRLQYAGAGIENGAIHLKSEFAGGIPLVVLWLFTGAAIFTLYLRFFNIWGFWHAVKCVAGRYDDPNEPGEVTHFQALASALSATVGLGNIAGVAIAMASGGPGAFFWMLMCGFLGMTSKCVECALGQYYRDVKPDGTVLGGPMQYLYYGLKERGLGPLGWVLSLMFAVMCILASFGGGNMFQGNQAGAQVLTLLQTSQKDEIKKIEDEMKAVAAQPATADATAEEARFDKIAELNGRRSSIKNSMASFEYWFKPAFGVGLAILVGVVIIGGIKRIAAAAEKIVPAMCLIYIVACTWIIAIHVTEIPAMIGLVLSEAFSPRAFGGGLVGVLVIGVQRAAFSNEAGVGSAAIAHSAAKTDEPIREGAVALLEPFIDTIIVCSMTALVMLLTGEWLTTGITGSELTNAAFRREIWFFPYILTAAIFLFAYSTQISWSYYGERCWTLLLGPRWSLAYKLLFVMASFCGVVFSLDSVIGFSDLMILAMAFPNVLGLYILLPKVRRGLLDYWARMKAEEGKPSQKPAKEPA